MVAKFGVVVNIDNEKTIKPIKIESNCVIGIVAQGEGENVFSVRSSDDEILKNNEECNKYYKYLEDYGIKSKIVFSTYVKIFKADNPEVINEDKTNKSIDRAFDNIKSSYAITKEKIDVLVFPEKSWDFRTKLIEAQKSLNCIGAVDAICNNAKEFIAKLKSNEVLTDKTGVLHCWPKVKFKNELNQDEFRPLSLYIAFQIAEVDSTYEYGFADSFSNRTINGVIGAEHICNFIAGEECDADDVRAAGGTTVIFYQGIRTWGGGFPTTDKIWNHISRVRIFNKVMDSCLEGLFWAIDRRASILRYAKLSLEKFLQNLKGNNVLSGFDVEWDEDKNTEEMISQGCFYLNVRMMEEPIVQRFQVTFTRDTKYTSEIIKVIE